MTLSKVAIVFDSTKQKVTAHSSTKSEMNAVNNSILKILIYAHQGSILPSIHFSTQKFRPFCTTFRLSHNTVFLLM
jgi:hypothetical protein